MVWPDRSPLLPVSPYRRRPVSRPLYSAGAGWALWPRMRGRILLSLYDSRLGRWPTNVLKGTTHRLGSIIVELDGKAPSLSTSSPGRWGRALLCRLRILSMAVCYCHDWLKQLAGEAPGLVLCCLQMALSAPTFVGHPPFLHEYVLLVQIQFMLHLKSSRKRGTFSEARKDIVNRDSLGRGS